jgi:hypothetical protein
MSTKIYHGFRFRSSDIFEIQNTVAAWRIELAELHRRELATLTGRMCAEMIDHHALNPKRHAGNIPFQVTKNEIRDRQKNITVTGYRDPEVDFDFELTIFPFEGHVYGVPFSDRSRWIVAWLNRPEVEDFSYWNNTDKPDTVSQEEWDHRQMVWDRILAVNPAETPAMAGFTAECTDRFLYVFARDIIEFLPTFEQRVASRTRNSAMDRIYSDLPAYGIEHDDNPFGLLRKIEKYLEGDGADILKQERSRVEQLLSVSIDEAMLTSPLSSSS